MSKQEECRRSSSIEDFQHRVLDWYSVNRRELPWRDETDPYRVLVSEVMLQQTGVGRVGPIYERFLQQFPTFEALAEAPRQDVLRAWAGSGYNRRAVYLQECAKIICRDYAGRLPDDPVKLGALPGLGPYTVAALLSFVFHRDVPALDTNIRRVLGRARYGMAVTDRDLRDAAFRLVPPGRSSEWNQALMDLGATVCTSMRPKCVWCPVRDVCASISGGGTIQPDFTKKVAERPEPYAGSRRFYRGRIVAVLRDLPPGKTIKARSLLGQIKPDWTPADLSWVEDVVRGLAGEGLAGIVEAVGEVQFTAPT